MMQPPLRYALYTPGQMALATLLGTPIAGGFLLGRNFRQLRRPGAAWLSYLFGIALTGVLVALMLAVPEFPAPITTCLAIMLVGVLGYTLQGTAITAHVRAGGRLAPWWAAVLIAVISTLLAFMVLLAGAMIYDVTTLPPKVELAGGEVFYDDGATEAQANATALVLVEAKHFDGTPTSVWIGRDGERYTVSLIARPDHTDWQTLLEPLSTRAFGGAPVDIQLCDENWECGDPVPWESHQSVTPKPARP